LLRSGMIRNGVGWTMAGLLVVSLLTWWFTRDTLPGRVRITTAVEGGQYEALGRLLADSLGERLPAVEVEAVPGLGTVENRRRLLDGEAQLGLFQAGAAPLEGLAVLAPLHQDVVHVVVRTGLDVSSLADLAGRRVSVGPEGSGMRTLALTLLEHYSLGELVETSDAYFLELLEDESLDAAIVTTGLLNQDLGALLATRQFELLPVLDAEALGVKHAFLVPIDIPRGLYAERPALPAAALPSVATRALLVAPDDASDLLVGHVLAALYESDIRMQMPMMPGRALGREWTDTTLHPAADTFFDPYRGIGVFATFMESLAAVKELAFALVAGIYLIWSRWNRLKSAERARRLQEQKDRLDQLLDKTVAIERSQMDETDLRQLKRHLDDVTLIKLEALEELSHEDLRGDRTFLIFLTQCANLIAKLQAKIEAASVA